MFPTDLTQAREVSANLVMGASYLTWSLYLPQMKRLSRVKDSRPFSLLSIFGSYALNVLVCANAFLNENRQLFFLQLTIIAFQSLLISMIVYYRRRPGGRRAQ